MQIYSLFPKCHDYEYAQAECCSDMYVYGTACLECKVADMARKQPMLIEWVVHEYQRGSTDIADFTWAGSLCEFFVTDRVRLALEGQAQGLKFGPVEMWQDPKLKRPKRMTSRTKRRIWLPYLGPPLWDFITTGRGEVDYEASKWEIRFRCSTCGLTQYESPNNQPLVFPRLMWDGSDFFLDRNRPRWVVFVTERGKAILDEGNFTNLVIKERGLIV